MPLSTTISQTINNHYIFFNMDFWQIFQIVGTCLGLIYIALQYKASVWLWPVGIVWSLVFVIIFFHGKVYAFGTVNLYYIVADIYGLVVWLKSRRKQNDQVTEKPITHTPKRQWPPLILISLGLWLVIYLILKHLVTDSPVPLVDGFISALSIVAMWMLAHKQLEQWLFWIVVNIVTTALFIHQGIHQDPSLYSTAFMYAVYTVVAVLGYFNWKKEMGKQNNDPMNQ